jgi:hypothetical protein
MRHMPEKETKFCRITRPNPWTRSADIPPHGLPCAQKPAVSEWRKLGHCKAHTLTPERCPPACARQEDSLS